MSTKTGAPLENTPISDWLEELHMECYKKNLEDFDTIRTLLDIKEIELKKLGVYNSKDRAAMLGSLANYRAVREETSISSVPTPQRTHSSGSKSVLRKGSLKKLNLKSLLGSGSAKKAKKKPECGGPLISAPSMASSLDLSGVSADLSPRSQKPSIPDYGDFPDSPKHFQGVVVKAIENEYGPSPQGSPHFRHRAHTIGEFYAISDVSGGLPSVLEEEDSPSSLLKHKHLSVISMESGLSFGYDVEKDCNPTLPLESQPWYHGRIMRSEAEGLLHEDGDFLVRENITMTDTFTLSMHWRGGHDHTLIGTTEVVSSKKSIAGGTAVKYQFDDGGAFDSIPELICNHLKYQIPLNKKTHNLLLNPVCRMGGHKGPIYGDYSHPPPPVPVTAPLDDFSAFNTLPKNFGSRHKKQPVQATSVSPEPPRHFPLRPAKSVSISPRHSPRNSPGRDVGLKTCSSSGDLLESSGRRVSPTPRQQRNAFSPPPVLETRPRASTTTSCFDTLAPEPRVRLPSFEDYELMESVSIKNPSPPLTPVHVGSRDIAATTSTVAATTRSATTTASTLQRESVKYAEIKYPRADSNPSFRRSQAGSAVKYAEVRFPRSQNRSAATHHPFSMYDTVPPPKHANPYQSRAEILAQKLQMESHPTASDSHHRELSRVDSTPHPFSHYASLQSLPRQSSMPTVPGAGNRNSMVPIAQTDTTLYSLPNKVRQNRISAAIKHRESPTTKNQESAPAAKNRESTASNESNRASPGLAQSTKVLKGLPGYTALVKLHTLFSNHSNEDLAFHVTKADAVCFMLAPRPGEDRDVWKERIRQVTSSSGVYVGIQTLGDPDGEKLWKKLYFRHLSFSQLVSLCIVSAGEVLDRTKMLRRFIDIAYLLQSSSFGNLFSFVAVMQGIAAPQVTDMTGVWALLHTHFPNTASTYKELQGFISGLSDDVTMYDINQLSVPAIQHLKTTFHYEESSIPGFAPVREDRSLLGEYSSLLTGLDGIRTIVSHCSQFCYNSRRRLDKHQYDATLMDFLMQDYTRTYLQEMGVSADSHLERRRRFGVLLDALVDRVEALESTEV